MAAPSPTPSPTRSGRDPSPAGGSARGLSLALVAVGGLLIFPLGAIIHTPSLEALGVILAVVGIGGALASRPASRDRPARPPDG
jgi:hypothetical protein